jgi:hypothetical protein
MELRVTACVAGAFSDTPPKATLVTLMLNVETGALSAAIESGRLFSRAMEKEDRSATPGLPAIPGTELWSSTERVALALLPIQAPPGRTEIGDAARPRNVGGEDRSTA